MNETLSTKDKLNLETAKIEWKDLQVFFAQGKLLIVEPSSDLVEVAGIIADNSLDKLESLIAKSQVSFATPSWIRESCQETTLLWAVVVSPYVIAQLDKN